MATDVSKIHIGQGDIWLGGTAPTAGVDLNDPTSSAVNSMTTNYAAPTSGGTYVGFTNGAATLTYKPTYYMVEVEQAFSEVVVTPTSEECTFDFVMQEASYTNLAKTMGQATTATGGGANKIYVGSKAVVTQQLLVMNSRKRSGTGYYIMTMYQSYSNDGIALNFERRKETQNKTTMRALADTTRPVGDQLFQLVEYTANPA